MQGARRRGRRGTTVGAPRHGFRVGDVPSRKLNFYFPASMVGYFDDLAAALQRDSVSESELAGIAEAHQMEIVGPSSERYV